MKTDKQMLLELQHGGKPWEQVLREALEVNRGHTQHVARVAIALGLSIGTVYNWCHELGIAINQYRRPLEAGELGRTEEC